MTPDQYWQWFWLDFHYKLLFCIPLIVAAAGWASLQYWYDSHENDEPKELFVRLKLK